LILAAKEELIVAARLEKKLHEKLLVWFSKPKSLDRNIRVRLERNFLPKTHQERSIEFNHYVVLQLSVLLVILFFTVSFSNSIIGFEITFITLFVTLSLINCAAILEQKHYIFYLEYIRLWIILALAVAHFQDYSIIFIGAVFTILTVSLSTVRKGYFRITYSERKSG
jgi:alkylglycerol monooxygenase